MKIIMLGAPGSGKGTVSEKLAEELNLLHVSAGELLREEVAKETTIGKEIKKYIEEGKLVPNQFVSELIKLEVKNKDNYILDGFPRSLEQIKDIEGLGIDKVIFLELSEKAAVERLMLRGRKDDTKETIKKRFRVYDDESKPVIDFYKKKGILKTINGDQTREEVYADVKKAVKKTKG